MSQYLELGQKISYIGNIGTKKSQYLHMDLVMLTNKADIEEVIFKLLTLKVEIKLSDIAKEAGLSKTKEADRKAIRRVLNDLIKRGLLQAHGAARARVYVRVNSETLLEYLSQPTHMRIPVGYNQYFLRSYQPNKTFYLSEADRSFLIDVGSVEHEARPAGTYARNILNRLLIDLSWNSSRLEGNTYSLLETKRLIEVGESVVGKDAFEAQMILNHKAAIEYIVELVAEKEISEHDVRSVHAILSENLLGDPSASGRLRQIAVGIGGTTYMPLENQHVLQECFELIIQQLNSIHDPFEQSFFALVQLSYLQAFEDVNKRTARIVANIPLIKNNLRPLSFTDVEQATYTKALLGIYEKNDISLARELYIWAYQRSAQKYSAVQQAIGEPNLLKFKYRTVIKDIIRTIILEKVEGSHVVEYIRSLMEAQNIPEFDSSQLFQAIETEILSLHDGNIARFKVRPSEFKEWKSLQ